MRSSGLRPLGGMQSLRAVEVIKRDAWSIVGRPMAHGSPAGVLTRRLLRDCRHDPHARASLEAEEEFYRELSHPSVPRAELAEAEDGEILLSYLNAEGTELDRVLFGLESRGWTLSPEASVVMLKPVFDLCGVLEKQGPLRDGGPAHGEIAPRSLLVGSDGSARLFEARFLATAIPWHRTSDGAACLAPEAGASSLGPGQAADVYSISVVIAAGILGLRRVLGTPRTDLAAMVSEELRARHPGGEELSVVLRRGLALQPLARGTMEEFEQALDLSLGLDEARAGELRAVLAKLGSIFLAGEEGHALSEDFFRVHGDIVFWRAGARSASRAEAPPPVAPSGGPVVHLSSERLIPLSARPSFAPRASGVVSLPPVVSLAKGPADCNPPPPMPGDPSRGFPVAVLDDWGALSTHLIGAYVGQGAADARQRREELRRILVLMGLLLFATLCAVALAGAGTAPAVTRSPSGPARAERDPGSTLAAPSKTPEKIPSARRPGVEAPAAEPDAGTAPQAPQPKVSPEPKPEPTARPRPRPEPQNEPAPPRQRRIEPIVVVPQRQAPSSTSPRPSAARRVEASSAAELIIEVNPWGYVFVDGEALGKPPVSRAGLTPGKHSIAVRRPGFEPLERTVILSPGSMQRVELRLRPAK